MSVKPLKAEAVLFYSQHPDGRLDLSSLHGGCPVLQGTKWAANLWVWNGPRMPYLLQMRQRQAKKNGFSSLSNSKQQQQEIAPTPQDETSVLAIFENNDGEGRTMKLYWQGTVCLPSSPAGDDLVGRYGDDRGWRVDSSQFLCWSFVHNQDRRWTGDSIPPSLLFFHSPSLAYPRLHDPTKVHRRVDTALYHWTSILFIASPLPAK